MKKTSKLFLFGVLALALLVPAALAGAAPDTSGLLQDATPTPTSEGGGDTGATEAPTVEGTPTSPAVEMWCQFCV